MKNIKFSFNRLKLILLFPVISLWPGGFAMPASSAVLFYEDFEDALVLEPPRDWIEDSSGDHGSQGLTTEQVRSGSSAYKFSLTRVDSGDYREELTLRKAIHDGLCVFGIGEEYWIGFSIFLPNDYYSPIGSGTWVIHHQYHSTPDKPPTCDWVEGIRNPILTIRTRSGNWGSWIQWDDQQCTPLPKEGVEGNYYTYDPFSTGQWVDFVINVKWSYGEDGFLKIWQNGVLITDRTGGTCFNDDLGPFLKIGIYALIDIGQTMTIYYDELRIGDENSSYSEVAPGGKAPCAENWICEDWSDWSDCLDNEQFITRTCNDSNECGTEDDKPKLIETQDCEILPTYSLTDFITLVSDWLKSETNLTSDLNNDNTVDTRDLGIMMSRWGE